MKKFVSVSLPLYFLFSCNGSRHATIKHVANPDLQQQATFTWKGVIPCADCPGIAYELRLESKGNFVERMVYLERDVVPFETKGTWRMSRDSIITLAHPKGKTYLLFKGEYLEMLDGESKPIETLFHEHYRLRKTE